MPKVSNLPKTLRPYVFHGVALDYTEGRSGEQVYGDCPFCGREGKFAVAVETGLWRCLVCGTGGEKGGGNLTTFLRLLWDESWDNSHESDYIELAKRRGLMYQEALVDWGVVQSSISGEWLVPGYGTGGKLDQLYRYVKGEEKWLLLATPGVPHALHGVNLWSEKAEEVYLCEGPWDGMALYEVLRRSKETEKEGGVRVLEPTGSSEGSLLSTANVLAVPGCGVFEERWSRLLAGKTVYLMYDSDHPREVNGKVVPPAGYEGMKRVAQVLSRSSEPPREVYYLSWGKEGYDPELPNGYDVRDYLTKGRVHADTNE